MNFSLNDPFTLKESTRPYYDHIHKLLVQSDVIMPKSGGDKQNEKKSENNHSHFSPTTLTFLTSAST